MMIDKKKLIQMHPDKADLIANTPDEQLAEMFKEDLAPKVEPSEEESLLAEPKPVRFAGVKKVMTPQEKILSAQLKDSSTPVKESAPETMQEQIRRGPSSMATAPNAKPGTPAKETVDPGFFDTMGSVFSKAKENLGREFDKMYYSPDDIKRGRNKRK